MNIPTKKLHSGFEMPIFGFGTWMIGGAMKKDSTNDEADVRAIKNAIEAGITHIDTAEKYAEGHAETLVGKAIQGYNREKLFLVTKVAEDHLHYKDVFDSLNKSLERLQTDYIDMYMIHGPSLVIPIEETMQAFDELMAQGLVKHIAVSNFTIERFEEAQTYTSHKIVANQLHYNLRYREAERKGLVEYCHKNDIMLVAWRPIQKGILSITNNELMDKMCQKYHKTSSQIALNWLISQKNIVTLSKMGSKEHLAENLGALNFSLSDEDVERLDKEFPGQQDVSDAVPLV